MTPAVPAAAPVSPVQLFRDADGRVLRAPPVKVPIAMNGKEFRPHIRIVTPGSAVGQGPPSDGSGSRAAPGAA